MILEKPLYQNGLFIIPLISILLCEASSCSIFVSRLSPQTLQYLKGSCDITLKILIRKF